MILFLVNNLRISKGGNECFHSFTTIAFKRICVRGSTGAMLLSSVILCLHNMTVYFPARVRDFRLLVTDNGISFPVSS